MEKLNLDNELLKPIKERLEKTIDILTKNAILTGKEAEITLKINIGVSKKDREFNDEIEEYLQPMYEYQLSEKIKEENSEMPKNIYGFGHTPLYTNVIEAIQNHTQPLVDAEAGRRALELVLAIYKSAAEGRPVKLPLDKCSTMDFVGRFDK